MYPIWYVDETNLYDSSKMFRMVDPFDLAFQKTTATANVSWKGAMGRYLWLRSFPDITGPSLRVWMRLKHGQSGITGKAHVYVLILNR